MLTHLKALNAIAERRGQSLAQLALSWLLKDPRITSVLVGASSVAQLEANIGAAHAAPLSAEDLAEIDRLGGVAGVRIPGA